MDTFVIQNHAEKLMLRRKCLVRDVCTRADVGDQAFRFPMILLSTFCNYELRTLRNVILCSSVLLSFEKVGCGGVHVNCLCLRRAILCFSGLLSFEKVGCGGVDVNCVCLRRGIFVFLRVVEFWEGGMRSYCSFTLFASAARIIATFVIYAFVIQNKQESWFFWIECNLWKTRIVIFNSKLVGNMFVLICFLEFFRK